MVEQWLCEGKVPRCCQGSEVRSGRLVGDHGKARVIQNKDLLQPKSAEEQQKRSQTSFSA